MTIVPPEGHAADRAGPDRRRRRSSARRARQRDSGAKPAGDDLLAAGRRPLSRNGATCFRSGPARCKIELAVGPFYSAVRQAAIVTSEESRGVDFTFGDGTLVLSGRAAEVGQSRVELPIAYGGPAISITLDPRFVSDFLKVLDPEKTFTIELKDAESAAVCTTDDGYGYVIMPLARDHETDWSWRSSDNRGRSATFLSQLMARRGYARVESGDACAEAWRRAAGDEAGRLQPGDAGPPRAFWK